MVLNIIKNASRLNLHLSIVIGMLLVSNLGFAGFSRSSSSHKAPLELYKDSSANPSTLRDNKDVKFHDNGLIKSTSRGQNTSTKGLDANPFDVNDIGAKRGGQGLQTVDQEEIKAKVGEYLKSKEIKTRQTREKDGKTDVSSLVAQISDLKHHFIPAADRTDEARMTTIIRNNYFNQVSEKLNNCGQIIETVQNTRNIDNTQKNVREIACFSEIYFSARGVSMSELGRANSDEQAIRGLSEDGIAQLSVSNIKSAKVARVCNNAAKAVSRACDISSELKSMSKNACNEITRLYKERDKQNPDRFNSNIAEECALLKQSKDKYIQFYNKKLAQKPSKGNVSVYGDLAKGAGDQTKAGILAWAEANKIKAAVAATAAAGAGYYILKDEGGNDEVAAGETISVGQDGVAGTADDVIATGFSATCDTNQTNYHQNPACETRLISQCGSTNQQECAMFHSYYCVDSAKGAGSNYCTYQEAKVYCASNSGSSPACSWLKNQNQASCSVNLLDASCLPPSNTNVTLEQFSGNCNYYANDPLCSSLSSGKLITKWSVMGETTATVAGSTTTNETAATNAATDTTEETTAVDTSFISSSRTIASYTNLPRDVVASQQGLALGSDFVKRACALNQLDSCE